MKQYLRIIASLSVLAVMAACQQFKVDTQMSPEKFAALVKLTCDAQESYTLSAANPQAVIFNVSANTPWTITGATEWLDVTPSSSGASSLISDITVTAKPNTSMEDRSATLTIKSDSYDTRTYKVTINQSRMGKLFVLPVCEDFTAAGGPLPFSIETNQAWEVRSDALWLTFSKDGGEPDPQGKPMIITATAARSSVFARTATVTVVAGDDIETFDVLQKARFSVTGIAEEFNVAGGSQVLKIRTDLDWEISSSEPWLSFDKTEGEGDGSVVEVIATAAANQSAVRKATVTVTAGDVFDSFEVVQAGVTFNIVTPEDPTINRLGGEIVVEVNTTLEWTVATDKAEFTANKIDGTHFKVSAPWNNIFSERQCTATITSSTGDTDSIVLTQDTNFECNDCEVLEDGSVKLTGSSCSRVYLKDRLRMINLKLYMGETDFRDNANFWVTGQVEKERGEVTLYNWLDLGVKVRLRSEGTLVATGGTSYYKVTDYTVSLAQLQSMTTYEWGVSTNAADGSKMDMFFNINGSNIASQTGPNTFAADTEATYEYFFGFNKATADGTWYVVKSCDLTVVNE